MSTSILNEFKELLRQKNEIEQLLPLLPKGYISTKTINDKQYFYLQKRVNEKMDSKYLKVCESDAIKEQVELRQRYKAELPKIVKRLDELEKAAKLIDKDMYRQLNLLKLSSNMDSLSTIQRECSASFANSLNAIEGVLASDTTQQNITKWINGEETYISVFQSTLTKYGFKVKV